VRTVEKPEGVLRALLASGAGCLLVEPEFFGAAALDALEELATHGIPVLTFCDATDAQGALNALRHGSFDVLVRPASAETLVERVSVALAAESSRRAREEAVAAARARMETLSSRENEIMYHIARGLLTKEIAAALGISQKTVEMFRGRILRKLDARGVADITRLWCALRGPCEYAAAAPNASAVSPQQVVRGSPRTSRRRIPTVEDRSSATSRAHTS
jgi:FixJ family two-component response regulator